ncbi:MAG: DUF5916 domain-containing protein [Bacteroidales bacterium]
MKLKFYLQVFIVLFLGINAGYTQQEKVLEAVKNGKSPTIDGRLTEEIWDKAVPATDFLQYEPYNGRNASFQSEVKIIYDDEAIYFGAILNDPNPDSIYTELGSRDFRGIAGHRGASELNADIFSILLNPFNDGVNMLEFSISASGVQSDVKHVGQKTDYNWDAVWYSSVRKTDFGWVAEVKIPYSALRFPNKVKKNWGLHLFRHIRRKREWDTWNYVDVDTRGIVNQAGELKGIHGVEPPLRLSLIPYLSGYVEKESDNPNWKSSLRGGMDLKYGINESFTLDMTLIPDFGQVETEDHVLNLSPFEVRYQEKRPFFTEGTELFDKAGIFYSRRIGGEPHLYSEVDDQIESTEEVVNNPSESRMINASKISGRTDNGLGIGVFNAMTQKAVATVKDTLTGKERDFVTQPFTNYNMLVFDQSLKNNSFISLVNTNLHHFDGNYTANVTGTEFTLSNEENSYQIDGEGAISQQYKKNNTFGYKYNVNLRKTSGNFRFSLEQNTQSDTYDPNDMGYLRNNNEFQQKLNLSYNIYEPFSVFRSLRTSMDLEYSSLYEPRKYKSFDIRGRTFANFKNHSTMGFHFNWKPETHDYFEPRLDNFEWKFIAPQRTNISLWGETNESRDFSLFGSGAFRKANKYNQKYYRLGIRPSIRLNDKFSFNFRSRYENDINNIGYVQYGEFNDRTIPVTFGKRNINTITNTFESSYKFTNRMLLDVRVRHYWRNVDYKEMFHLKEDGYLSAPLEYSDSEVNKANLNYNAFTVYFQYLWRFLPGSELSVVWQNQIFTDSQDIPDNYIQNLDRILSSSQVNSLSLKLVYYLDYQKLKQGRLGY